MVQEERSMKKWWVWLISAFAVIIVLAAASGINKAKSELSEKENDPVSEEVSADDSESVPEVTETDSEEVEGMLSTFYELQEDLEKEYSDRIGTNNVDNWGPYFKDFNEKIDVKRDEIKESEGLSDSVRFDLGQVYSNLLMLGMSYGKAISGDDEAEQIEFYKGEIEQGLNSLKEGN